MCSILEVKYQYVLFHLHKDLMLCYVVVIEGAQSGSNFDV